mmetsp:Transcript_97372/g.272493  ORF Transcript_97372/g.272493 Transcript_97372/m.272493 type:complete len:259 (+) Transcript_97372:868-1644(+)
MCTDTQAPALDGHPPNNERTLEHHVLAQRIANPVPSLNFCTPGRRPTPHDKIVRNGQRLFPGSALVSADRQSYVLKVRLWARPCPRLQRLQALLVVEHRREKTLPEPPLAIEVLRQRSVVRYLPGSHDGERIQTDLWFMQRIAAPLSLDVASLPKNHDLVAVFARRCKDEHCGFTEMHRPQPWSATCMAVRRKTEVSQSPLRRLVVGRHLHDLRTFSLLSIATLHNGRVDHETKVRGLHGAPPTSHAYAQRPPSPHAR